MTIDPYADAKAATVTGEQLADVGRLVAKALELEELVAQRKDALKQAEAELRTCLTREIPEAMTEAGVRTYETVDGRKVALREVVSASIPKARQEEAYAWLREHGHGDLIKNEVIAQLGRGGDNEAGEIAGYLEEHYGVPVTRRTSVHASSLSAFCREQLSQGADLPSDLLGIYHAHQAKIS